MANTTLDLAESVRRRHAQVREIIADAAALAGRQADSVRLVVVTKSQPFEIVRAAIDAGAGILGENYAEEAVAKMTELQQQSRLHAGAIARSGDVEWHMIGHVQSRKAKIVAEHFELVHSLDSVKLGERLSRHAVELGRVLPVLLEFNVGGETGKSGWVAQDESAWPQLLPEVEALVGLPGLSIRGLMTMPPLMIDAEQARPFFQRLRRLRDFLAARLPGVNWKELSMGTSMDYGVAVEEGATLVRVGEAILGPRPTRETP
jgi:hypothetical protein